MRLSLSSIAGSEVDNRLIKDDSRTHVVKVASDRDLRLDISYPIVSAATSVPYLHHDLGIENHPLACWSTPGGPVHPAKKEGPIVAKEAVASISPPDKAVMEGCRKCAGALPTVFAFRGSEGKVFFLTRLGKARDF